MGKKTFPVKTGPVSTRVTEQVLSEIERIVLTECYNDVADYLEPHQERFQGERHKT